MLLVLIAIGLAALLGPRLGVPRRWRWLPPALVWLGWLLVLLGPGHAPRARVEWALLGAAALAVAAYARWLRRLRVRAAARLAEAEQDAEVHLGAAVHGAVEHAGGSQFDATAGIASPESPSSAPAMATSSGAGNGSAERGATPQPRVACAGGPAAGALATARVTSDPSALPGSGEAAFAEPPAAVAAPAFSITTHVPEGAPAEAPPSAPLDEGELARYSRHILLHEIGGPGQRRLKAARVLVVGAGGLGSPVLQYLAAAGVGTLSVVDDDEVEASNLHRQVIHAEGAIGRPKVDSALATLAAQNPHLNLQGYRLRLSDANAPALFARHDLILDGSDSFDTREMVNRAAVTTGRPLISGALTQWEGQVTVLDPARGAPCYTCLFPQRPAPGTVLACAVAGVAGPLPGVIGTLMALEALKEITGAGRTLRGRLLIWDGLEAESRTIRVHRRPGCPTCGHIAATAPPA